jgi:hypothetical protein
MLAPVCIAGMHRSGTSMVARLLNLCGLYLGKDEELMPPDIYNIEGYWENLKFVEINDSLLLRSNATWAFPPSSDFTSELHKLPPELLEKAEKLIQSFKDRGAWGWKDPRNSLTLPFWQRLIPNLKVIICLRNPVQVSRSLTARDNFSKAFGLDLWYTYNQHLTSTTLRESRLTTHFFSYFSNPQEELHRLLEFIGFRADNQTVEIACAAALKSPGHNHASLENMIAEGAPLKVINLYADMCSQTGSVFWNAIKSEDAELTVASEGDANGIDFGLLQRFIEKDPVVLALAGHVAKKEQAVQALSAQLAELKSSKTWRIALFFRRIRGRLAPANTLRDRMLRRLINITFFMLIRSDEIEN